MPKFWNDSALIVAPMSDHADTKPPEELLSRRQLAARWKVSNETLKRREREGILKPLRFNQRLLRYRLADVIAIEEAAGGLR